MNFISLFSGGGGADIGAMAAGYTPVAAIEYDPAIAGVYAANIGDHVRVGDILTQDLRDYPACDLLHASPPCPNFSVAKAGAMESAHDIALAGKVAEFIRVLAPRSVTIENVPAYRRSESYRVILRAIEEGGYMYDAVIRNSADYGVAQTRRRLIVRATRGLLRLMPEPVRWVGWYEAIEDLIDTLPESKFADWQLKRLPMDGASFAMQVQGEAGDGIRQPDEPMQTVTSAHGAGKYRAFLMPNANSSSGVVRNGDDPAPTVGNINRVGNQPRAFIADARNGRYESGRMTVIEDERPMFGVNATNNLNRYRAFIVDGKPANYAGDLRITNEDTPAVTVTSSMPRHPFRAWLDTGRVVKMTPRALARFQSFPDWYVLPDKASLACRIIGNAVPPLMYAAVARSVSNA